MDLEFEPDSHVYTFGGEIVPSVTGIISGLYDFSFVDRATLSAAADFGTAVHRACELRDLQNLDMDSLAPPLVPYLAAWERFLAETNATILEVEKRYHHSMMGYAGTLDRVLEINRRIVLVDIKTVSRLTPAVGVQLAAYQHLLTSNTLHRSVDRAAVQLKGDGTYSFRQFTDPTDWPVFVSLLTLNTWKRKHAA